MTMPIILLPANNFVTCAICSNLKIIFMFSFGWAEELIYTQIRYPSFLYLLNIAQSSVILLQSVTHVTPSAVLFRFKL